MKKRRLTRQSLGVRFRRAVKSFENRLIEEQALKEAMGHGTIESINTGLFKRLNYKDLLKRGLTRKEKGTTYNIKGEEAVLLQIKSLYSRSSPVLLKENYIRNYINSMNYVGYSQESINEVHQILNNLSPMEMTIAINENLVPQIHFVYAEREDKDKLLDRLRLINKGTINEKIKIIEKQFEERKEIARRTYELNKALNR